MPENPGGQITVQETLFPGPLILDSTCSFKRIWPAFATLRMDIRRITKPDIVADARYLPFRENVFDSIYCDPPHLIRKSDKSIPHLKTLRKLSGRTSPGMFERYGYWRSRSQWKDFAKATDLEFARCLKRSGELHYKLTDGIDKGETGGTTNLSELIMSNFFVIKDRIVRSKTHFARERTKVHYLTFRKSEVS